MEYGPPGGNGSNFYGEDPQQIAARQAFPIFIFMFASLLMGCGGTEEEPQQEVQEPAFSQYQLVQYVESIDFVYVKGVAEKYVKDFEESLTSEGLKQTATAKPKKIRISSFGI